jgi:hypothetical protein
MVDAFAYAAKPRICVATGDVQLEHRNPIHIQQPAQLGAIILVSP